ncbi:MAG: hypothetical protein ACRESQ_05315 [Gammaproteobacteria bacterium]
MTPPYGQGLSGKATRTPDHRTGLVNCHDRRQQAAACGVTQFHTPLKDLSRSKAMERKRLRVDETPRQFL